MERLVHMLKPYFVNEIINIIDDIKQNTDEKKQRAGLEEVAQHIREDWKNNTDIRNKTCDRLEAYTKQKCKTLSLILKLGLDEITDGFIMKHQVETLEIEYFVIEVFSVLSLFLVEDINKTMWYNNIIPNSICSVAHNSIPWNRVYENIDKKHHQEGGNVEQESGSLSDQSQETSQKTTSNAQKSDTTSNGEKQFVFSMKTTESASKWRNTKNPKFKLKHYAYKSKNSADSKENSEKQPSNNIKQSMSSSVTKNIGNTSGLESSKDLSSSVV